MRSSLAILVWLMMVMCVSGEDLHLRLRVQEQAGGGTPFRLREFDATWPASKTAIIVCDLWDLHHCLNAVRRVGEFAPRLNEVLTTARAAGVTIIHAPSDCMDFYTGHPARQRAISAPSAADAPIEIAQWCSRIPSEEAAVYPIDQSDGGEDDDPVEHAAWVEKLTAMGRNPGTPWKRQTELIRIDENRDFISDRGDEVWNILQKQGIEQVILTGVHVNMCVLGRPFGLRQLVRAGKQAVLMRDMTDAMYNPARWPFVDHFTANDRIISHIERYVCPTISSDQLIGGAPFRFRHDVRPHLVMLIAEDEYELDQTLPTFATEQLGSAFRVTCLFGDDSERHTIPGIELLRDADVAVVAVRRRLLPTTSLDFLRQFVAAGKPVVGIRTANHAFSIRSELVPEGLAAWPSFDADVLGGNYQGHHASDSASAIHPVPGPLPPMIAGLNLPTSQGGSLYRTAPLAPGTTVLLTGEVLGHDAEPVAWTFLRDNGGKSFYTSMGHKDDFANDGFVQLLRRAIYWAASLPQPNEMKVPTSWQTTQVPDQRDGVVWYRCAVRISAGATCRLEIHPSQVAWINGHQMPNNGEIAHPWLNPNDLNLLVVRTQGGLADAPTWTTNETSRSLSGRWQYRLGDDSSWSNIPLPARFGASTDIVFD